MPPIEAPVRGELKEFDYREVQILPSHLYAPAEFAELAAVNPRTFREAKAWLIDHGRICPYVDARGVKEEGVTSGFILPFRSGIRFRSILEAVEKAKKESAARSKGNPGGKGSFGAMLRRSALKKLFE